VHEANHLPCSYPDLIAITRNEIGFDHGHFLRKS
jgi:hypothetical protein